MPMPLSSTDNAAQPPASRQSATLTAPPLGVNLALSSKLPSARQKIASDHPGRGAGYSRGHRRHPGLFPYHSVAVPFQTIPQALNHGGVIFDRRQVCGLIHRLASVREYKADAADCQRASSRGIAQRKPRSLSVKNGSFMPRETVRARRTRLCHEPPRVARSTSPAGSSRPSPAS